MNTIADMSLIQHRLLKLWAKNPSAIEPSFESGLQEHSYFRIGASDHELPGVAFIDVYETEVFVSYLPDATPVGPHGIEAVMLVLDIDAASANPVMLMVRKPASQNGAKHKARMFKTSADQMDLLADDDRLTELVVSPFDHPELAAVANLATY